MHRTEGTNNVNNLFTSGPPGTNLEENWLNSIQEEACYVIEQAGLVVQTAGTDTHHQLKDAIDVMVGGTVANAPKSTVITETVPVTASCVTLDSGGIKSWDAGSNAIFSVTEAGAVTLGYSGNDVISLSGGTLLVATATSADLIKLHAVTSTASEINELDAAGAVQADFIKLHAVTASAAEVNRLDSSNGINITLANTSGYGVYVSDTNGSFDAIYIGDSARFGMYISDVTNEAIKINDAGGDAIEITTCTAVGLDINGYGTYGITIDGTGSGDALFIGDSGAYALRVATCTSDALRITYAGADGLHIVDCGGNAIQIEDSTGDAITINSGDANGIAIAGVASDAIFIGTVSGDGIQFGSLGTTIAQHALNIRSVNASYDGLHCDFDGTAQGRYGAYFDNSTSHAVTINNAGDDGIHIVYAAGNAIEIVDSDNFGIKILDSDSAAISIDTCGTHALSITNCGSSGVYVTDCGHSAFQAAGYTDAGVYLAYDSGSVHGHMVLVPGVTAPGTDYAAATAGAICTYDINGDGSVIELWIQSGTTDGWVKVGGQ